MPTNLQDCLAGIMLGDRRAAAMDEQKRSLATIKAVMKKLFVGEDLAGCMLIINYQSVPVEK